MLGIEPMIYGPKIYEVLFSREAVGKAALLFLYSRFQKRFFFSPALYQYMIFKQCDTKYSINFCYNGNVAY
jgi:hypothetical protein